MSMELHGLKEFEEKLDQLSRKVDSLEGTHQVTISDEFVQAHSEFKSMSELLDAGNFKSIEEADDEKFDKFISEHSDFDSWHDFQVALGQDFFNRQLGFRN